MLKRGFMGTYDKMSPMHLHHHVKELASRHNGRDNDAIDQMRAVVANMVGRFLSSRVLKAGNGLSSRSRQCA